MILNLWIKINLEIKLIMIEIYSLGSEQKPVK